MDERGWVRNFEQCMFACWFSENETLFMESFRQWQCQDEFVYHVLQTKFWPETQNPQRDQNKRVNVTKFC